MVHKHLCKKGGAYAKVGNLIFFNLLRVGPWKKITPYLCPDKIN